MARREWEENAINRVLKARGLPSLAEPGVVVGLAALVEDHQHFTELLRACDPYLRREMYEALSPHLRFRPRPLESYIIASKEHAAAAELPTLDSAGNLHQYSTPVVTTMSDEKETPDIELFVQCSRCEREGVFYGERLVDAIHEMRDAGWCFDESTAQRHLCFNCLDENANALDSPPSETPAE